MLPQILIGLAALAVVFVIVVALRPAEFRVTRATRMSAPPLDAFAQVNDFHNWEAWSPWAKIDPTMTTTYDGPTAGVGAAYSWVGNSKVGEGRMTLLESRPSDLIRIKLEFVKPFKATNVAEFTFHSEGDQTVVTWSMTGQNNFVSKAFHLLMNIDKLVGGDFEKGLAAMKSVVETRTA